MIDKDRIPTPEHLFTWVDVDEYFAGLAMSGGWPSWLIEVDAFWDSVELTVAETADEGEIWAWLASSLGPLTVDRAEQVIILESADGRGRPLPVSFRRASEPADLDRVLRWKERRIVGQLAEALPEPANSTFAAGVRICAFHSFKGGVGRTLHCVALARQLAKERDGGGRKVLLVDADLEAPGITWMMDSGGRRSDFALEDFLALLHGTDGGDLSEPLGLAKRFLANQEADGVVVLPARRSPEVVGPPRIEPSHLPAPGRSRYFLTDSLAELAAEIGADVVLIDLRAGASELSAPVLLDQRVLRVFVTTVSDQSVRGAVHILRQIGRQAPSQKTTDPRCAVLVTQFDARRHDGIVFDVAAELAKEMAGTDRSENAHGGSRADPVADQVENRPLFSPFDQNLLALPGAWGDVCQVIDDCRLGKRMKGLADWLRLPPSAVGTASPPEGFDVVDARRRLHETTRSLAGAQAEPDLNVFLRTEAVTRLLAAHRTETPIDLFVGMRGSGKTYTYLRMCASRTWADFASAAHMSGVELSAPIVPVFASSRLGADAKKLIADAASESAHGLSGSAPAPASELRDLIAASLREDLDDTRWRSVWLACLARSAGLVAKPEDAEDGLTELARNRRAIFAIDGLEDLFRDYAENARAQRAVRVLRTDCMAWLRKLRGNPLGLLVFVRDDLVFGYSRTSEVIRWFPLSWGRLDALRFTARVFGQAGAFAPPEAEITSADQDDPSRFLVQLWGYRLYSERSRRVRSEDWFIAALANFDGRIQPGDVVAFLATAAEKALDDPHARDRRPDRLLTPAAMREALDECSLAKINLIKRDDPSVGELLTRLQGFRAKALKVPFKLDEVELDQTAARRLEHNGVLYQEGDLYWIPEIYRSGLGLQPSGVLPLRWLRPRSW